MNRFITFLFSLLIFSCVVSPRYTSNNENKNKPSKINKRSNSTEYNKNKKIYEGISSWYGPNFHGKLTANGEIYDMYSISAAHKSLPLGTYVKVTNLDNDKSTYLTINDRGPYVKDRILDCSMAAAKKLGFYESGIANVRIEVINFGDGDYMKRKRDD